MPALEIDDLRGRQRREVRYQAVGGPGESDPAIMNGDGPIRDRRDFGLGGAPAWGGTGTGQEPAGVNENEISGDGLWHHGSSAIKR